MLYRIYKALAYLSVPFLAVFILLRALFFKKRAWSTYFLTRIPSSRFSHKIWIHAVSLGEVITAKPLIASLLESYPNYQIYLSTMTETGFQEASKMKEVLPFYLPIDLPVLQQRVISKIHPDLVLYIEGDIWPSMHNELLKAHTPQVLLSAKLSQRSLNRLCNYPQIKDLLYLGFTAIWTQDALMERRYKMLGLPYVCIKALGNLKVTQCNSSKSCVKSQLDHFLKLDPSKKTVVIASTHAQEEVLILEALGQHVALYNLIFVPRHPERFREVERLLKERHLTPTLFSNPREGVDCFLVDTVGILNEVFKKADLAILGGSFVPGIGGHNLMEPLYAKIPVIFGPYVESKLEMKDQIIKEDIGAQSDLSNLLSLIKRFLSDKKVDLRINHFLDGKQEILPAYLKEIGRILKKQGNPCG